jgi:hypothetical protein
MIADEDGNRYGIQTLNRADALRFGRVTYELMVAGSRRPGSGESPGGDVGSGQRCS